jgi:hypothetical protein
MSESVLFYIPALGISIPVLSWTYGIRLANTSAKPGRWDIVPVHPVTTCAEMIPDAATPHVTGLLKPCSVLCPLGR